MTLNGFAIILEDNVFYCSNESMYSSFEIVLFIEKLISSINPKKTWRLTNISLKGYRMSAERILIKHEITEQEENLFYCVSGDFSIGSKIAPKILNEFYSKVKSYYKNNDLLKQASKKPVFKEIIEAATDYLWDSYEESLDDEKKKTPDSDPNIPNNLLYCGISTQGLPIISQLYSGMLLKNLDREITEENVELYSSNLSAKLATIAMNTVIRAKTSIKEIIIQDINERKMNYIILYGEINNYSLDFFGSGNYAQIKLVFNKLKETIVKEDVLQEEFDGDLKPFKHLHKTIKEFYLGGL